MDFLKLLELLKENADATAFIKGLQTEQAESKDKMLTLATEADKYKAEAKEVEKYKTEAKEAFETRDKLKEQVQQLKDGSHDGDKQLLEKIESLELQNKSLSGTMLEKDRNEVLNTVLSGMEFRGEGEARERLVNIVRSELSRGLVKNDEFGFVYEDQKGNLKRNPDDVSKFLTPKDIVHTKEIKEFMTILNGVPSSGDGFEGGQGGGGGGDAPKTFKEKQAAFLKSQ